MAVRKRNEFLDDNESGGESDAGYDSEAAEASRGALTGRNSKRRKIEDASASDDDGSEGQEDEGVQDSRFSAAAFDDADLQQADEPEGSQEDETDGLASKKPSAPKSVTAAQKASKKSGVIYISRVPPFMKPQTLRHLLTPHAPKGLGRIFLTPQDQAAHARRVKSGGNKKKSFTDGWVEFASKRDAKVAAELLNGNIIGGKKGNFYHDDLWNMKYLRGFKWSHLTEQIRNEDAERAARLKEEVRRTKEENRRFIADFERGRMLEGIEGKRRAKGLEVESAGGAGGKEGGKGRRKNEFKQRKAQGEEKGAEGEKKGEEFLQRAGRKIF